MRADGCCVSDFITKCDAGLAINQISKAKSETMPLNKRCVVTTSLTSSSNAAPGYYVSDITTKCGAGLPKLVHF